jgi:protein gp37
MIASSLSLHAPHLVGVSVEDKRYGMPRIAQLRATQVLVRFLSVEPLLEDLGQIDLTGIHWVIVGGESGPGARRIEQAWVESIRDQCVAAQVPFFFKQWGGFPKIKPDGSSMVVRMMSNLRVSLWQSQSEPGVVHLSRRWSIM